MKAIYFFPLIIWLGSISILPAQRILSGTVQAQGSGEYIGYASVRAEGSDRGTLTNSYGFFSLEISDSTHRICIRAAGFAPDCISLTDTGDFYVIYLTKQFATDTVTIEAAVQTQAGHLVIPTAQLEAMPALMGEPDAIKGLQMLPGVQFGVEGTAGLYIRGGTPDQNLILLDEIPVYNVSHLYGFFSLFPPDALNSVELYRGGFPAQYGGRLSSVIKLQTKDGNLHEWKKKISVGLISSGATVEGPLIKNKTSLFVSARRSWIDLFIRPGSKISLRNQGVDGSFGYYFYDVISKVSHKISDKSRLFFSFYAGQDRSGLNLSSETEGDNSTVASRNATNGGLGWGNITGSLRLNRIYNDRLFSQTTLGYTQYRFRSFLENEFAENDLPVAQSYFEQASLIRDFILKHKYEFYVNQRQRFNFGVESSYQVMKPDVILSQRAFGSTERDTSFNATPIPNRFLSAYAEHIWEPGPSFRLHSGIRLEGGSLQRAPLQGSIQPRIATTWVLHPKLKMKASYAFVRQYLHLLSSSGLSLPADIWAPATPQTPPAASHQGTMAWEFALPWQTTITLEGYYKTLDQVIAYQDGASYLGTFESWEEKITSGQGRAYGLELFLHKPQGRLNGWLSYTLSRSTRQFDLINDGEPFRFRFDRPHNLSLNLTYKLKDPRKRLSMTWMYVSGARVTVPTKRYDTPFDIQQFLRGLADNPLTFQTTYLFYNAAFYADERNNLQTSPFHKLDISYAITKEKNGKRRTWTFGVYNLYGQRNPLYTFFDGSAYFNEDLNQYDPRGQIREYSFLMWIPSVRYQLEF